MSSGAFSYQKENLNTPNQIHNDYWFEGYIIFDSSKFVPTGNENSARTISDSFWRRVA